MIRKEGLLIVFEGIDGSGKSTQIRKLVNYIFEKSKYNHVILTRNPYKDVNIRAILRQDNDPLTQAEKLADLFINDRKKQVEELVKPNLEKGHFVISDRYKLSTITYQAAQGLEMEDLIKRHEGLPIPDITFMIDVSPEEARKRMEKKDVAIRGKEHKFETNLDFARKLRENHYKAKEILEKEGEKIFIINGERSPEEIFEEIKDIFEREIA
ncbi:MAG: dTMP kinase [Nanoarchaeota archaeon]|nr:dTMP kinase [Nanoarchaeota archaeon]